MLNEKRDKYRRYEDRRVVLMLNIHEILFDKPAGAVRNCLILDAIQKNYGSDRSALVIPKETDSGCISMIATAGDWGPHADQALPGGLGLDMLWNLQDNAPGALTLTRVKRPSIFPMEAWEDLWNSTFAKLATAVLSVRIESRQAPPAALWILQASYSREWSSRDRCLAEELASLLARARDKEIS